MRLTNKLYGAIFIGVIVLYALIMTVSAFDGVIITPPASQGSSVINIVNITDATTFQGHDVSYFYPASNPNGYISNYTEQDPFYFSNPYNYLNSTMANYVPYNNANQDVNLNNKTLSTGRIIVNPNGTFNDDNISVMQVYGSESDVPDVTGGTYAINYDITNYYGGSDYDSGSYSSDGSGSYNGDLHFQIIPYTDAPDSTRVLGTPVDVYFYGTSSASVTFQVATNSQGYYIYDVNNNQYQDRHTDYSWTTYNPYSGWSGGSPSGTAQPYPIAIPTGSLTYYQSYYIYAKKIVGGIPVYSRIYDAVQTIENTGYQYSVNISWDDMGTNDYIVYQASNSQYIEVYTTFLYDDGTYPSPWVAGTFTPTGEDLSPYYPNIASFYNGLGGRMRITGRTVLIADRSGNYPLDDGTSAMLVNGTLVANSFKVNGGSSMQFLKGDGSLDSTAYLTSESDTLDSVTGRGSTTTHNINIGILNANGIRATSVATGGVVAIFKGFSSAQTGDLAQFQNSSGFIAGRVNASGSATFRSLNLTNGIIDGVSKINGNLTAGTFIDMTNGGSNNGFIFKESTNGGLKIINTPLLGTHDTLIQGGTSSSYTYLEDYGGSGVVIGTGYGGTPIIFNPDRAEVGRINSTGFYENNVYISGNVTIKGNQGKTFNYTTVCDVDLIGLTKKYQNFTVIGGIIVGNTTCS